MSNAAKKRSLISRPQEEQEAASPQSPRSLAIEGREKFRRMKKKQPQIPSPNMQSGKQADFPLPEPMELAKLAAILWRSAETPNKALQLAVKWYFEAMLFVREHAASEIQALFEQKQKEEKQAEGRKELKRLAPLVGATLWDDTVRLDEAWEFLANPEKLAARLGQIPKEGEQLLPAHKRERLVHELPEFSPKVKTSRTLMDNLLLGLQYFRAELRIKGDDSAHRIRLKEVFNLGRIPVFLLPHVLRARYERRKETQRNHEHRKQAEKKPPSKIS